MAIRLLPGSFPGISWLPIVDFRDSYWRIIECWIECWIDFSTRFTGSSNQFRNYKNWIFVLRKVCWKSFFKLKTVWPDTNKQQIFINNFRIHSFRIGYWILWATWSYVIVRRPRNLKKSPTLFWHYLLTFFKFLWPSHNIWSLKICR